MNAVFELTSLLESFADPLGVKLALALLHFVWQGVLIAAVAAVLMRWVGRHSPHRRYAIGVASLALMAVAPVITFCLVAPPEPPPIEPLPLAEASDLLVDLEQIDMFLMTIDEPSVEAPVIAPQAVRLSWPERLRLIQPYAVLLWLAGSLLCGLRLVVGAYFSRKCRRGRRAVPEAWLAVVVKTAARIGIKRPQVFVSDRVAEAIAVGLLRPMVLLPAAWIGRIPPDVLEAVLAHELAHLRRYDLWVNLFQRVVESLLFYHPAVWWLSRRIRIEREYCCDETAAEAVTGRAAYARALEYVATERVAGGRTELFQAALAAGMRGEDSMTLLNRVHRVLGNETRPRRTPRLSEGLLALAVPVALWAAVVTIGPAFAQEDPVEAPQTEPTLDDVVEDVYRDFDVQPGKSLKDVVEGIAQSDEFGNPGDGFGASPRDELHEALRDLRQELKALQSEVEELRDAKGEPRTNLPVVHASKEVLWRDFIAAIQARDEAYGRILRLEKTQVEDPAYERFAQERYREAENHLAELHQRVEQVDSKLFERMEGAKFRVVTDLVESEDGKTRQFKRLVPIDAKLDKPSDDHHSPVDDSLPAEVTDKDGRRYRAVTESIETKDGKTIRLKRHMPVEPGSDAGLTPLPSYRPLLDPTTKVNRDQYDAATFMLKYKAAGLLRDDAMRELAEAKAKSMNADVISALQTNVDQAQRWLNDLDAKQHATFNAAELAGPTNKPSAARQTPGATDGLPSRADGASANVTGGKPTAPPDNVTKALEKPVSLHFDKTPLNHVIATLRNIAGVNFVIDEAGLDEEGIRLETPVSVNVDDMAIREVLSTVLSPLNLTATTDDGVVVITSRQRSKGPLVVETYPVSDLVLPPNHGNIILDENGEIGVALRDEVKQQAMKRFDALVDLITATIEPGSWEIVGGQGVIRKNDPTLSLIIRQTGDVHDEIAKLLQRLRQFDHGDQKPDKINRTHFTPAETKSSDEKPDKAANQDGNAATEWDRMVAEYNELIEQRLFAEAITVAKRIRELDPENQVAVTMLYKAKVLLENTRHASPDRHISTEALLDSTSEIEPARKVPNVAYGPIVYDGKNLPRTLLEVRVEGNRTVPTKSILEDVEMSPGQQLSSDRIAEDTQRLLRTRRFLSVTPHVTSTDDGATVTFEVVERPKNDVGPATSDDKDETTGKTASVKVRVQKEGTYYVDGYAASTTGLASAIKEAMTDGERTELVIQADKDAPFSAVARVIEAAKEIGVDKVRFAIEPNASANDD